MAASRLLGHVQLLAFAATLFVSAFLLFLVQPLIGKMVLPHLGGSPSVWNTCMVFFQAMLLAGYLYAHASSRAWGVARQSLIHLPLLLAPLVVLPLTIKGIPASFHHDHPIASLLVMLTLTAGLPFFVISTSAPLLQKWFAATGHPSARDPYFLYAASNLGSLLALAMYPSVVEPAFGLKRQSDLWAMGYAVFIVLISGCVLLLRLVGTKAPLPPSPKSYTGTSSPADRLTLGKKLRWIALAFIPSSWLLGASTFVTSDLAPLPLLWVAFLAVYLISFILVFSRWPAAYHSALTRWMPALLLLLFFVQATELKLGLGGSIAVHLLGLLAVALVCHGELAQDRPAASQLTTFYLCLSVGGVLGGAFNALLAPVIFKSYFEYPLALVLVAFALRPRTNRNDSPALTLGDLIAPAFLAAFAFEMFSRLTHLRQGLPEWSARLHGSYPDIALWLQSASIHLTKIFAVAEGPLVNLREGLLYALPIVGAYLMVERRARFGLAMAGLVGTCFWVRAHDPDLIRQDRSFFGVLSVKKFDDPAGSGSFHQLNHGVTLHGKQFLAPERRREPLTYYHRTGPIGQVFEAWSHSELRRDVAVIGLGTGTMASYGNAGDRYTFYEIDKLVCDLATNSEYFTFLTDAQDRGVDLRIILGDARLQIGRTQDESEYGIIVVDAFSSDAIPVHLITKEALELYLTRLSEHGVLAFHISNGFLDLEPVLGNLAKDAGLTALIRRDPEENPGIGKCASDWVVLARRAGDLEPLTKGLEGSDAHSPLWNPVREDASLGVWTDDFSNLLRVFADKRKP